MNDLKLTLKLNENSIKRAKIFSSQNGVSLSAMVEKFFDGLTLFDQIEKSPFKYSPVVSELSGIISIPDDYDSKSDYLDYLETKYE